MACLKRNMGSVNKRCQQADVGTALCVHLCPPSPENRGDARQHVKQRGKLLYVHQGGASAVGLHVLLHCGDAPAAPSSGLMEGSEPSASMTMAFRAVKVVSLFVLGHSNEGASTARPIHLLHTLHSQYLSCPSMPLVRFLSAGPENRRIRYLRARQSGVPLQVL